MAIFKESCRLKKEKHKGPTRTFSFLALSSPCRLVALARFLLLFTTASLCRKGVDNHAYTQGTASRLKLTPPSCPSNVAATHNTVMPRQIHNPVVPRQIDLTPWSPRTLHTPPLTDSLQLHSRVYSTSTHHGGGKRGRAWRRSDPASACRPRSLGRRARGGPGGHHCRFCGEQGENAEMKESWASLLVVAIFCTPLRSSSSHTHSPSYHQNKSVGKSTTATPMSVMGDTTVPFSQLTDTATTTSEASVSLKEGKQ